MPQLQMSNLQNFRLQSHELLSLQQRMVLDLSQSYRWESLPPKQSFRLHRFAGTSLKCNLMDYLSNCNASIHALYDYWKFQLQAWLTLQMLQIRGEFYNSRGHIFLWNVPYSIDPHPHPHYAADSADLPRLCHNSHHRPTLPIVLLLLIPSLSQLNLNC